MQHHADRGGQTRRQCREQFGQRRDPARRGADDDDIPPHAIAIE
jgi:hypothetical protein